jgi:hypothetical protein
LIDEAGQFAILDLLDNASLEFARHQGFACAYSDLLPIPMTLIIAV